MGKKRGFFKFLLETTVISMLNFIQKKVVDRINHIELRNSLTNRIIELEKVASVLTDANPDDKTQLNELWESEIKPSLQSDSLDVARDIIDRKVTDPAAKAALLGILDSFIQEYDLVGIEAPNNQ